MSKLRPINEVYGTRLRTPEDTHDYVLLKEWMLKPLWLQYSIGIQSPVFKLPGAATTFKNDSINLPTTKITLCFDNRVYLILERIYEPGIDHQLRIIRSPNV